MSAKKHSLHPKKLSKGAREQAVLFGLIDLYIKTGKAVGSQTLQESGFESLSSATIRNYFGKLETLGFLKQPHTSGGRLPTEKAFRLYANHYSTQGTLDRTSIERLEEGFREQEPKIANLIRSSAELLSTLSRCAVFISTPRFDQDFVQDVRLLLIDPKQILAVVITDFGAIRTETLYLEREINQELCSQCQDYFLWRLNKREPVLFEKDPDHKLCQRLYNEVMVRHVINYLHFSNEEIVRCGVSRLLSFPEFSDAASIVHSLALLENEEQLRCILRECVNRGSLSYWIGDELCPKMAPGLEHALLSIPYRINQTIVGAVAILAPMRVSYAELFALLHHFGELLSKKLTDLVYKFKITFRQPMNVHKIHCTPQEQKKSILLEDKTR